MIRASTRSGALALAEVQKKSWRSQIDERAWTALKIELPHDLGVTLALLDDIDLSKTAIGDPVRARLENDLKSKGRILIAKSAAVSGRVTRLEAHSDFMMVGLMFDEIESPAAHARVRLRMVSVALADHVSARGNYLLAPVVAGEGIIPVRAGRTHLNRGLLMSWSTEP